MAPERATTVPHEVELKYRVTDLEALRSWLDEGWAEALPWATLGQPRTKAVEDRYFDTAREALRQHGFGARLRRVGGRHLVTVKSLSPDELEGDDRPGRGPTAVDGDGAQPLHRRIELEGPASGRLDPGTWPSSPARELVDELRGAARLRGLFTIRQVREVRVISSADGTAELSLDEVRVIAGRSIVGTFAELEVESTGGSTDVLAGVARALAATELLVPVSRSKEAQARAMVDRELAQERKRRLPRVPKTPGVLPDDTLAEAGRKVLRMHLARMLAAEEGTRRGEDIEELHKMRVATRRMRSVWRVFDGAYRPKVQRRYVRELRTVASALGMVRDLDVQLEALDAWASAPDAGLPDGVEAAAALRPIRDHLGARRDEARRDLIDLLDSRRYQDFVSDYLELTSSPGAAEASVPPGSPVQVRHTAGGRIWSAYEHLRAHEAILGWADIPALHAVRIDAKRLRYTLESFREVLPPTTGDLIAKVTALQDHLGLLNDADIAAHLVREHLMANGPRLSTASQDALSSYLASREALVATLRRGLSTQWRPITAPATRRALASIIAAP
ncbi:MAG: CHAD domain-containing protein [Candidatus Limnocylindrales bacterium]